MDSGSISTADWLKTPEKEYPPVPPPGTFKSESEMTEYHQQILDEMEKDCEQLRSRLENVDKEKALLENVMRTIKEKKERKRGKDSA